MYKILSLNTQHPCYRTELKTLYNVWILFLFFKHSYLFLYNLKHLFNNIYINTAILFALWNQIHLKVPTETVYTPPYVDRID